jgi:hypothetical protein
MNTGKNRQVAFFLILARISGNRNSGLMHIGAHRRTLPLEAVPPFGRSAGLGISGAPCRLQLSDVRTSP